MGAAVSIDKHTTPIEEWLELQDKLDGICFEDEVTPHLSVWKLFADDLNPQEFNCLPLEIDLSSVH